MLIPSDDYSDGIFIRRERKVKFSDVTEKQWEEFEPYLDTCLLPITGLSGMEKPWEVTQALTKLRDVMEYIENPFKGRVITYPSVQYRLDDQELVNTMNQLCNKLKKIGFTYVIIITANPNIEQLIFKEADLLITSQNVAITIKKIEEMWNSEKH